MDEMRHDQAGGNSRFYSDLPDFDEFFEVANPARYQPLPGDWQVVIADIRGSTQAIEEGRYKDVNMIGAACITSVLNVTEPHQVPYVFGGDGATLAVPRKPWQRHRMHC